MIQVRCTMGHQDLQYGWTSGHNSVGGIGLQLTFKNMSEKTIKYIYFYFFAYNAVGDVQECSTTGKVKACLKYTGPLEPEKVARNTWDCVWYNSTISTCTLSEVEIEYMDGSTEKIDGAKVQRYEPEPSGCMYNIAQTSGLSIFSFLMPPIGFMLYHLYKDKEPKKAECIKDSAYKGLLIWAVILIVFLLVSLGKLINA